MGFFDTILTYLATFWDFISSDMWIMLVEWLALSSIKSETFFIRLAWDFASVLLESLSISPLIEQSWNSLDPGALYYLTFFRIPESLNIIIQAGVTRFIIGRF